MGTTISGNVAASITRSARLPIRIGLFVVILAAAGALILFTMPAWLISWETLLPELVIFSLIISLYLAVTVASDGPAQIAFRCLLVIWIFLLLSEEVFTRSSGDLQTVLRGEFSIAAYGELGLWVLAFFVLLIVYIRSPGYFRQMFSGRIRWILILCGLCIASTVQSPGPLYSGVWALRLCVVALLLAMSSALIRDTRGLVAFCKATLWALVFYLLAEICRGIINPSTAFEGGRFGQSTNSLSVIAGSALILVLTLRSQLTGGRLILMGTLSTTIMFMSGGKAGIASGVLAAALFYLLNKKVGSAVVLLTSIACLGIALYVFTPLGSYFNTYKEEGGAETLSGRTDLWEGAWPLISQHIIVGHGYMASRFASRDMESVKWEADHMHNAFLDVLYNNGLIGLGLMLIFHALIVTNLCHVIGDRSAGSTITDIAAGALALYTNLAISAFFNSTIGGRTSTLFMLFLALLIVSESLRRELTRAVSALPPNTPALVTIASY
jgi:O-antigen ligase